MRIPRAAMIPALDTALRDFVGDGEWYLRPSNQDQPSAPDKAARFLLRHYEWKWLIACLWIFGALALGIGGKLRASETDDRAHNATIAVHPDWGVPVAVGTSSAWWLAAAAGLTLAAIAVLLWRRSQRPDGETPTAEFLAAALDRLELAPVQRRYAEALVAVYGGGTGDPGGETLALLRRLTEEEERLLALARTMEGAAAEEVAGAVESLRSRLTVARDPAAREALAQSLALAERRLPAAERAAAVRERLDAHASLLDQASRTASEAILGRPALGVASSSALDDLRANVAALGGEVAALEAAVEEMRTL